MEEGCWAPPPNVALDHVWLQQDRSICWRRLLPPQLRINSRHIASVRLSYTGREHAERAMLWPEDEQILRACSSHEIVLGERIVINVTQRLSYSILMVLTLFALSPRIVFLKLFQPPL